MYNNKNTKDYNFNEYSKKISYLSQEYTLFKNINIFDQCIEPAIIKGSPKNEVYEECNLLMNDFGIYDKKNNILKELFGGQKQRAAIIKILLCKNELILLDETTSALDKDNSEILFFKIKEFREKNNSSFIISSHDNKFINQFSNIKKSLSLII